MAIDTEDKRRSTLARLPVANSAISAPDRAQVIWHYSGIAISAPVAVTGIVRLHLAARSANLTLHDRSQDLTLYDRSQVLTLEDRD